MEPVIFFPASVHQLPDQGGTARCGYGEPAYQFQQDTIIRSSVEVLRSLQQQLADVEEQLGRLLAETDYRLPHIPGVDAITAAELVALVGDVTRYNNVDKFMAYTGLAPTTQGTGETETRYRSQYGRRELNALFYRIATTQLVVHAKTGEPRNPEAKAYYGRLLGPEVALLWKNPSNLGDGFGLCGAHMCLVQCGREGRLGLTSEVSPPGKRLRLSGFSAEGVLPGAVLPKWVCKVILTVVLTELVRFLIHFILGQ